MKFLCKLKSRPWEIMKIKFRRPRSGRPEGPEFYFHNVSAVYKVPISVLGTLYP